MLPDSFTEEKKVLSLYYTGLVRDEISKETVISTGKISGIIDVERKRLGEQEVAAIRRIGREMAKNGKSWEDIASALVFSNYCQKHDFDQVQLMDVLVKVNEKCSQHGIALADLPRDIDDKTSKAAELERRADALRKEMEGMEATRAQKLEEARQTDESLARYMAMQESLSRLGLPADSPKKLENALANAELAGYNVEPIVVAIAQNKSLRDRNAELAAKNSDLEVHIAAGAKRVDQQNLQISKNSQVLGKVAQLEQTGLDVADLKVLTEVVSQVAIKNGIEPQAAKKKFMEDVAKGGYDSMTGFARKAEELQDQYIELEVRHDKLKMNYAEDKQTIEALQLLHSKGMKNYDVLALKSIVNASGVATLSDIEADITLYGDLKTANKEAQERQRALATDNLALEKKNELLGRENEALRRSSNEFKVTFENEAKGFTGILEMISDAIESATDESIEKVKAACNDMRMQVKAAESEQAKILEMLRTYQNMIKRYQGLLQYEPLERARRGEQVQLKAVTASLSRAIDTGLDQFTGMEYSLVRSSLKEASRSLRGLQTFDELEN